MKAPPLHSLPHPLPSADVGGSPPGTGGPGGLQPLRVRAPPGRGVAARAAPLLAVFHLVWKFSNNNDKYFFFFYLVEVQRGGLLQGSEKGCWGDRVF